MKVGILTWSKVVNHGAVLQAYATQQVILHMGHIPVMLDYQGNKNGMQSSLCNRLKNLKKKLNIDAVKVKLRLPKWDMEKAELFAQFRDEYISFGENYAVEPNLDTVLIGSDMVFDFYEGYNPFMYGKGVNSSHIFSYAACFGYVNEKMFSEFDHREEIVNYIGKMDGIGYRDDNTWDILNKCCGVKIAEKNIDPVLLYGFNEEAVKWDSGKWKKRKYILVYAYSYNMDKRLEVKAIRSLAQQFGLEIVSVGYIHNWCDESVNADPKDFIEIFSHASYIVTDTFHGTVFSLIFNKQFCIEVRNNAFKVVDLLKEMGLDDMLDVPFTQRIMDLPNERIDYNRINERLSELRKTSLQYIEKQLQSVNRNDG